VSLAQTIDLFTHVLSGITINIIPEKVPKYRTVWLNTGHLVTLLPRSDFSLYVVLENVWIVLWLIWWTITEKAFLSIYRASFPI